MKYDVFICHASEDKVGFVDPLARALRDAGVAVWYDEFRLEWGDSLRRAIDQGLANSRYGIVLLSPAFLKRKKWAEHELDGLLACEQSGNKVVLPVWHNVKREDVLEYAPALADRFAKSSDSIEDIVRETKRLLAHTGEHVSGPSSSSARPLDWQEKAEAFAASVLQVGGIGSRLVTKTAWLITGEHAYLDADRFIHVAFNNGGDIMYLGSKEGYEIVRCTSPTGNQVIAGNSRPLGRWCGTVLEEKLKNELIVEYRKTLA